MREQYPFFRDGDEQTQAIIGEEAVNADLDGEYQKPYAVLTQKRLYCKNEQGNFIADASALRSAGRGFLPGQNWFLWAVAACVALALAWLCLWYWGMDGQWHAQRIHDEAQQYIKHYDALERSIPEYQRQIETYENAQKAIEADQQLWREMGYDKISGEMSSLQTQIERAKTRIDECGSKIKENEYTLELARKRLPELQESLAQARRTIALYEAGYKPTGFNTISLSTARERVANDTPKVRSLTERIAQLEKENQQLLEEMAVQRPQLTELRKKQTDYAPQAAAMEEMESRIQSNREIMANIDHTHYKNEIKKHEASRSDYQTAQHTQQKINLFWLCLIALAICALAALILTILKRVKAAVIAALASAFAGLGCAALSIGNMMPLSLSIALWVLPIPAVTLGVLALRWNRKKTAYQIVHNTGAFYFNPSVYPAEELRLFTEQVQLIREGGADGE